MKIRRIFAVIPLSKANGHGAGHGFELFETEEKAEAHARRALSGDIARTGYVIYQAEALVQRVTAPVEVCGICDDGEVVS